MAGSPALWRRVYDTFEKPVGDAMAAGTGSGVFGDILALAVRVPRRMQHEVERRTRHVLHFANLPTATDVRRLTDQVTEVQRELRALSRATNSKHLEMTDRDATPSKSAT
jgi:hypothetical protein